MQTLALLLVNGHAYIFNENFRLQNMTAKLK